LSEDPTYIVRGGELVYQQPLSLDGTTVQGFVLDADPLKLAAYVDRTLNAAAGGKVRYEPILGRVLLVYSSSARAAPATLPDRDLGWLPEIDVLFWIPCLAWDGLIPRVVFTIPYSFVDTPNAMAMGREIYGFPKTIGRFSFDGALPRPDPLVVSGVAIEHFAPTSKAEWQELFRAQPVGPAVGPPLSFTSGAELFAMIGERLLEGLAPELLVRGGTSLLDLFATPTIPLAFLKQLRDAEVPARACYQAVIEAPATTTRFRSAGVVLEPYEVVLRDLDSVPIARELGLQVGANVSRFSFWADFDFQMGKGRVVHELGPTVTVRVPAVPKKKIAILGGGMGALAAAYALTEVPGWDERFELTVYQLGWRLGGKGASGRNPDAAQRIEEHGLHVWLGFYENAFGMMRRCYEALGRQPGKPLATWDEAFKPHDVIGLMEEVRGAWRPWILSFPRRDGLPGDGAGVRSPAEYLAELLRFLRARFDELTGLDWDLLDSWRSELPAALRFLETDLLASGARRIAETMLDKALELVEGFLDGAATLTTFAGSLLRTFSTWLGRLVEPFLERHDDLRRLYILIDLSAAIASGMILDEIPFKGFDAINEEDFAAWLARHGASPLTLRSAVVRGLYQLVFAFPGGDSSRPGSFEAGTGLRAILRLSLDYRGAIFWKMQAGMGDVVFAPMYEVLARRGVKFNFFHKVDALRLSPDRRSIARVEMTRQATLVDPAAGYRPLVDVQEVPSWPSVPGYDQLVEGAELRARGVNLEDPWADWTGVGQVNLQAGVDYDQVILGIPVGALGEICADLVAVRPAWRDMVTKVKTVQTLAMQLWLKRDLQGLGWMHPSPILDGYAEPFDTWADMSHLIPRETWTGGEVKNIAYFCGALKDAPVIPGYGDHGFPARELLRVRGLAADWLERHTRSLWPAAARPGSNGLDLSLLVGTGGLDGQYLRANVSPSERYVLSVPGSTKYRLAADRSGFSNLVLAGDWLNTGLDAGCIEAAVMGGLQAARAVSGEPLVITGDHELERVA
jgi:uncharacterized protein with NAD-binding domain and iron-sulfur cluster